jgi:uncharacterized protein (DUF4415 family)
MPKAERKIPMLSPEEEARLHAGIAADPDNPELTDDQLAAMRHASDVLPPGLFAALARPRGRPKAASAKVPVKLRLDAVIVETYKATGHGWQTRMNNDLAAAAKRIKKAHAV